MGRLERVQERKMKNTIILYVVVFLLVLYFIFTYGIHFLLGFSNYIADVFPEPTPKSLNKTDDSFRSIDISTIPQATNSAQIIVSGSSVNFNSLDFYLNSKKIKTVNANLDSFNIQIGDLQLGNNDVYILAKTKDEKTQKKTVIYKVFYKNDKPKLDVSDPADNSTTNNQEIKVKGVTDKETYIRVNDSPVVVDANGSFETSVRLKDGDNQILIVAEDMAGNTETKTLKVTYQKE